MYSGAASDMMSHKTVQTCMLLMIILMLSVFVNSPDVVVYMSAISDAAVCQNNETAAALVNVPVQLMNACAQRDVLFVYISTDLGK